MRKGTNKVKPGKTPVIPGEPTARKGKQEGKKKGALLKRYEALYAELEVAYAASHLPREKAAIGQTRSRVLEKIGRLTGEGEISEAMILASHTFQRVLVVCWAALEKYPDAAASLAKALEHLESNDK